MKSYVYVLDEGDNVGVALKDLRVGDEYQVEGKEVRITERIPFGFKVSLREIHSGTEILKDGFSIGVATKNIPSGALVHVHNVKSIRSKEWVMTE